MRDNATNYNLTVGNWYFIEITQNVDGFNINCDAVNSIIKNKNYTTRPTLITNSGPITTLINHGLLYQGYYNCNISLGGQAQLTDYVKTLIFDLAWIHFFDYSPLSSADVLKECSAMWQFTQFPDSLNTYKTLS